MTQLAVVWTATGSSVPMPDRFKHESFSNDKPQERMLVSGTKYANQTSFGILPLGALPLLTTSHVYAVLDMAFRQRGKKGSCRRYHERGVRRDFLECAATVIAETRLPLILKAFIKGMVGQWF